ncbi:hypothetical protein ACFXAW_07170 [Streptomyces sp. NPDC059445]|uniref:hypothetical protein n=1 Tax=Streptomyces sp. NPDC059445 TaxID=3346832 RepID=UPI0036B784AD
MTRPLTSLDLDEIEARAAALYEYGTLPSQDGQNALDQLTDTDVPALVAEVRCLRTELADARVQSIRDLADKADPQRPEISWFGDYGPQVAAWMRKQAEYEQQRLAATPATDTLPAWLYSRFNESLDAPAWDRLTDADRTYWEHQARAVRRAVARGGFKADPTPPAVVPAR